MRIFEISGEIQFKVAAPQMLNELTIEQMIALIEAGGQITSGMIQPKLFSSHLVAWAEANGRVVAVKVLKSVNEYYREFIFQQAEYESEGFNAESGFSVTDPKYRRQGISKQLSMLLFRRYHGKVFATIREENKASEALVTQFGFKKVGSPFIITSGATINLWVRE